MKREQAPKFVREQFLTKTAADYNTAGESYEAGVYFFGRRFEKFYNHNNEFVSHNHKLVIEYFRKACDLESNNYKYLHSLAYALDIEGSHEEALKYYKSAYVLNSSEPQYNRDLAHILYKLKRYDEAKEYFISTIKLERLAIDYYNLGIMFFNIGNYEKATLSIQKAINQVTVVIEKRILSKPNRSGDGSIEISMYSDYYTKVTCHLALSNIFYLQDKFNDSEKEALKAVASNTQARPLIYNNSTDSYVAYGRKLYNENTCSAMELLCKSLIEEGKHDEAERYEIIIDDIKGRVIQPLDVEAKKDSIFCLKNNPNEQVVYTDSAGILIFRRLEMNIEEKSQPQEGLKEIQDPDKKLPELKEKPRTKATPKDLLKTLEIRDFLKVVEKSLDGDGLIQLKFISEKAQQFQIYPGSL